MRGEKETTRAPQDRNGEDEDQNVVKREMGGGVKVEDDVGGRGLSSVPACCIGAIWNPSHTSPNGTV